jgi:hypothetical protein
LQVNFHDAGYFEDHRKPTGTAPPGPDGVNCRYHELKTPPIIAIGDVFSQLQHGGRPLLSHQLEQGIITM